MPIIKQCLHCKAQYKITPSRAAFEYCSRACKDANNGRYVQCAKCGKTFRVKKSKTNARWCSRKCQSGRNNIRKKCGWCGKSYERKPCRAAKSNFCSSLCRGAHERRITAEKNKKDCVVCAKPFFAKPHKLAMRNYCSRPCSYIARRGRQTERASPYPRSLRSKVYNARSRSYTGKFSLNDWLAKCEYWGWRCYLCRIELTRETAVVEHRIPITRGGSNWLSNLAPACDPCNSRKHNKTEAEYRQWLKLKQERVGFGETALLFR